MVHKHFILISLTTFIILAGVVTIGRITFYDSGCHQRPETIRIGNVNASIEPCGGTYVRTDHLGIPAFYSLPHEGEFGTVAGEFNLMLFLFNVLWMGIMSGLIGLFVAPRMFTPKPPVPQSDASARK